MFLIERWVCRDHDVPLFQSHSGPQPPTRLLSFRLRNAILGFSFVAAVLARAVGSVPLHWPGQQSRLWTEGHGLPWAGTQRIDARAPYPRRAPIAPVDSDWRRLACGRTTEYHLPSDRMYQFAAGQNKKKEITAFNTR